MPYALREAFAAFRRAPVLVALSAAMIGLSLFVLGLFGISAHNIRRVLEEVEQRVEIVAYLRDDAPSATVQVALSDIRAFPEVLEALYVSREQALENARRELPEFRTLFADLDVNPLPGSFEIRLLPGQAGTEAVAEVAERVASYPFVEEVGFGREWVEKVYLLRRVAGAAALIVGGAFALVAALIIGAAIRMAIFARRDEIAIMRLVGATNGFIQKPFLIEGLMTGLLGAGIALSLTFTVYKIIYGTVFKLDWMPDAWVLGGLGLGGLLGLVASALAVRWHLREI